MPHPPAQRTGDLGRLFDLAARVSGLEALRAAWREYIQAAGSAIVKDDEKVKGRRRPGARARLAARRGGHVGRARPAGRAKPEIIMQTSSHISIPVHQPGSKPPPPIFLRSTLVNPGQGHG
jgi:hypothetical protein